MRTRNGPGMTLQRTLRDLLRHFLTGSELSRDELHRLIDRAIELKAAPYASDVLARRSVALIFQKPSTRTRVSFESGIAELGGHPMVLRTDELQLTRGESVRDTAYVLSRHAAAIGIRTGPDELVEELASYATVPVVNMLTAHHHPCQALADLMTLQETFGRLDGSDARLRRRRQQRRSFAGDPWRAGRRRGPGRIAARATQLEPVAGAILTDDPHEAAAGANALYTDVWVSMSDDPETAACAGAARSAGIGSTMRCSISAAPRRDRDALPARASRRGDHGRGALRRAPADLGSGGEPPTRAEGAARASRRRAGALRGKLAPAALHEGGSDASSEVVRKLALGP